jgi:hypothetical protein
MSGIHWRIKSIIALFSLLHTLTHKHTHQHKKMINVIPFKRSHLNKKVNKRRLEMRSKSVNAIK